MKKIVSLLLVCVLLVGCVFALASCSKTLSGKYVLGAEKTGASYEFSGNKVTVTYSLLGVSKVLEGTYEIVPDEEGDGESIIITIPGENDAAKKYSGSFSFVEGREGDESYIKIGGVKYVKSE